MRNAVLLLVLFVLLMSSGCSSQKSWVYATNKYDDVAVTTIDKTVAIIPFKDERKNANDNMMFLYAIPLFPYGYMNYEVPEGQVMHIASSLWVNYKPVEDFPKALAEELRSSKLFKDAFFDFKTGSNDLLIKGRILSTNYKGKIISYGLGVFGPYFWFLGAPAFSIDNDLKIHIECLDIKTNKVLLSKEYAAVPVSNLGWIYAIGNDFNYPEMLQSIYKEFVADLKKQVLSQNN